MRIFTNKNIKTLFNKVMETAVAEIDDYLIGDTYARIEYDDEGEMYKLFHFVRAGT